MTATRAQDLPPRAGGGAPQAPAGRLRTWGRFVRFEHTLFSLPLLFAGVLLGAGGLDVSLSLLGLVLLAGTAARTAALGLNRIIDRRIDAANPRTATRELPSGAMGLGEACALTAAGAVVYAAAAWWIAPICLALAPIPLAVFTAYPYLKRWTPWCHLGVGLGLAMAPLGGWFAVRQEFSDLAPPLLLGLFTLAWVAGFDVIYATLDEEFDRKSGVRSLPARYGRRTALRIARGLHALAWVGAGVARLLELPGRRRSFRCSSSARFSCGRMRGRATSIWRSSGSTSGSDSPRWRPWPRAWRSGRRLAAGASTDVRERARGRAGGGPLSRNHEAGGEERARSAAGRGGGQGEDAEPDSQRRCRPAAPHSDSRRAVTRRRAMTGDPA